MRTSARFRTFGRGRVATLLVLLVAAFAADTGAQSGRSGAPLEAFTGRWEAASDDGTALTVVELSIRERQVTGALTHVERGYFSGRETVSDPVVIHAVPDGAGLSATLSDPSAPGSAVPITIIRRGEYLVMQMDGTEQGFARPGRSLVQSAAGSPAADALARAIAGRVYSAGSQAAGRNAFVGARLRVAFCADGRIEYDASDLASTGGSFSGQGVDFGTATSRRGRWSVVLLAGAPAVLAQWQGTGTSYSLTRYFVVRATPTGATIDGAAVGAAGTC